MGYYDGWLLANDQDYMNRVGFASEQEGRGFEWGIERRYAIAASPGFAAAYSAAIAAGTESPGRDESVISDLQILAAIQAQP